MELPEFAWRRGEGDIRSVESRGFRTRARVPKPNQNYAATQDTFVSVGKVYETIEATLRPTKGRDSPLPLRALDLGAGAGMSTETLWNLGYHNIVAVDQSREAWDLYVESQPPSVEFYHLTDAEFVDKFLAQSSGTPTPAPHAELESRFDAIVFNFAVNPQKASDVASRLLRPGGKLLAPVNTTPDYWFEQVYIVYDYEGKILKRAGDILFQPDVTEPSCQGIWCARKLIDRL